MKETRLKTLARDSRRSAQAGVVLQAPITATFIRRKHSA